MTFRHEVFELAIDGEPGGRRKVDACAWCGAESLEDGAFVPQSLMLYRDRRVGVRACAAHAPDVAALRDEYWDMARRRWQRMDRASRAEDER